MKKLVKRIKDTLGIFKISKGFTLIELLVVVLIIGILAGIALPQYKMIVLKSNFATVKQNARALWEANRRYYMVHDKYTANMEDLDIEVEKNNKFNYYVLENGVAGGRYQLKTGKVDYWIYGSGVLCSFTSSNATVFNILDNLCKQETNNGKKGCNSSSDCHYYYNKNNKVE